MIVPSQSSPINRFNLSSPRYTCILTALTEASDIVAISSKERSWENLGTPSHHPAGQPQTGHVFLRRRLSCLSKAYGGMVLSVRRGDMGILPDRRSRVRGGSSPRDGRRILSFHLIRFVLMTLYFLIFQELSVNRCFSESLESLVRLQMFKHIKPVLQ